MSVPNHLTLTQLADHIRTAMTNAFAQQTFWVVADIADYKFSGTGPHYFTLVEKDPVSHALAAKIRSVAWPDSGGLSIESFQRITGQLFKSDIRVLVNVSVSYHPVFGLQLLLNDIDTTFTIGQLELQRRETLQRLLQEYPGSIRQVGDRFITTNNQLKMARVLQRIAVVTASGAAGYIDFRNTIEHNAYGYHIELTTYFTAVQGEANIDALCQTMIDIHNTGIPYDAVVIIRGGGTQTDFLLFNQFKIARIVAKFPIPVIAGIGHQINETIVDLMAHTSVKTPSIAAETIITHNKGFEDEVLRMQQGIIIKSQQVFNVAQKELGHVNSIIVNKTRNLIQNHKDGVAKCSEITINHTKTILYRHRYELSGLGIKLTSKPVIMVNNKTTELQYVIAGIATNSKRYFTNMKGYIGHHASVIKLISPENMLKRGFAILYQNQRIVTDPNQLSAGTVVSIRLQDAAITANITDISKAATQ